MEVARADLTLPFELLDGQISFESCLPQEGQLLSVKEVSHLVGVIDNVIIGVCAVIESYPLQTSKERSRGDTHKSVYTNVSDIGLIPSQTIGYEAMFLDVLPARAVVHLFGYFDRRQIPLKFGRGKVLSR